MPKKPEKNSISKTPSSSKKGYSMMSALKNFFKYYTVPKPANDEAFDSFDRTIDKIRTASKYMSDEEKHIFNNFLLFGHKTVAKVMIPRSDICAVSIGCKAEELNEVVLTNGHTRTLVYQDTLDNILGFVHIKDIFNAIASKKEFNLRKLVRKLIIAAPSMKLVDLLAEMQKRKTHIAVILDEYGGTDGIVTIEDVMEEIVGQIEDEHDAEDQTIENFKVINPSTVLCNARTNINDIEKALKLKLKKPDDDFETVGGLVLSRAGHVPKSGSTVLIEDNIFAEIIESNSRTIKTIKLMVK